MNLQLNGKKALVSGSTAGIGYAIAKELAKEGAIVYINGRTVDRVENAVAQIKQESNNQQVFGITADLSTAQGVSQLTQQLPQIDILINNLGTANPKPFMEITDEDWQRLFDINVLSGIRLARTYFTSMLSHNWGRVIFIASESALQVPPEMIDYGVTKTAQIALARGLAELTKGTNVTVNSILPGPTLSEGFGEYVGMLASQQNKSLQQVEQDFFEHIRPTSLINRFIQPDEIAQLVTYLASPLSAATNGSALRVDGGVVKSAF
ncbi:SDR family oxidoreductase [Spirosoma knui]